MSSCFLKKHALYYTGVVNILLNRLNHSTKHCKSILCSRTTIKGRSLLEKNEHVVSTLSKKKVLVKIYPYVNVSNAGIPGGGLDKILSEMEKINLLYPNIFVSFPMCILISDNSISMEAWFTFIATGGRSNYLSEHEWNSMRNYLCENECTTRKWENRGEMSLTWGLGELT